MKGERPQENLPGGYSLQTKHGLFSSSGQPVISSLASVDGHRNVPKALMCSYLM